MYLVSMVEHDDCTDVRSVSVLGVFADEETAKERIEGYMKYLVGLWKEMPPFAGLDAYWKKDEQMWVMNGEDRQPFLEDIDEDEYYETERYEFDIEKIVVGDKDTDITLFNM